MAKRDLVPKTKEVYGCKWNYLLLDIHIEIAMVRFGGHYTTKAGKKVGNGMFFHFKRLISLLWPFLDWHKWNELILQCYIDNKIIGIMGPASSGKTCMAAAISLADYYCWADRTTIICTSTEREMLEMKLFGEIKAFHKKARALHDWLPGNLIESRQRIVTDERYGNEEGRDFRSGCCGVPCKKGGSFVGLGCPLEGTFIDTPEGPRKIEDIKPGDYVFNALGVSRVRHTMSRVAPEIVKVTTKDGRSVFITPEHPFLTQEGWVKAIDITPKHRLLSWHESMQILQEGVYSEGLQKSVLQQDLCDAFEMDGSKSFSRVEGQGHESNGGEGSSGNTEESGRKKKKGRPSKKQGWCYSVCTCEEELDKETHEWGEGIQEPRQWIPTFESRNRIHEDVPGSETRTYNSFWEKSYRWVSALLQTGLCFHESQTSNRDRWGCSQKDQESDQGREENGDHVWAWVENIEVLKRTGNRITGECEKGYRVYNLEVEGHHSYSACGFLIKNSFVGIKNKRVRLIADEGNLMPRVYVDAVSNLAKNQDFKCMVMGNPMGTDNGLAMICEPNAIMGGWDAGIDQTGGTKTWDTRFKDGICIQLVGSDSPNAGAEEGKEPYPYLIKDTDIAKDEAFYGKDSWQYLAMDDGRMPRGQGARRVITRQMCLKFGAMEEVVWSGTPRTSIGFLDAAYSRVGGDRCVFGELQFGKGMSVDGKTELNLVTLINTMVVPITMDESTTPEDQIVNFVMDQCSRRTIEPRKFYFDSTGRGSLMNAFGRLWSPHVQGIEFGGVPTDRPVSADIQKTCREHYYNLVSELWYSVRLLIEAKQFRGMTEDVMQEGCAREWQLMSGKKIQVEPKEKMKVKMGRSPDLFDALACGVEGARRNGFIIARLSNASREREGEDWRDKVREKATSFAPRKLVYSA